MGVRLVCKSDRFGFYKKSFNPRTHVGCDLRLFVSPTGFYKVSIHAPTWGATKFPNSVAVSITAFQSTHPRGVRRVCSPRARNAPGFQSTHPRGVRLRQLYHVACTIGVSIHAPTWGATLGYLPMYGRFPVSIHAPTWGATYPGVGHAC